MNIRIYKGTNYKKIMNEIIKDYPGGYKITEQKETVKNKFLFWMKDYEVEVNEIEEIKNKKERSKKILDILDEKNVVKEEQLMQGLLKEGEKNQNKLENAETTKEVIEKIKKQVEEENKVKQKEKEEEIRKIKELIMDELQELDIEKQLAKTILDMMSDEEIENPNYMKYITNRMKKMMRVTEGYDFEKVEIVALIGPTGVGKTTTIAKLAGAMVHKGYKVGMVTTDVYRVGAIAQLKIYADILETEINVAKNKEELQKAIEEMKEKSA